ncbi:MAG TPA: beta-hydroxyacyl-ACP dehydratase [Desulfurivibrio alkaliphilus]|uniref:Beta-hydroxyacyl-ACP dehydratase n=1 Tax=Desulfurivibrio alkaliphilus TaxID=427923 RepID=A0A7C2TGR5_9BACT|nr:beta-hydroxyacyl-ACP dehydratase [Desulfurivibrio alkaliphilus]
MPAIEESLHNSLRRWQREQREGEIAATGEFSFAPTFPAFNGHFPGQPILPAVVQLAAVRHLAELAMGEKLSPGGCRNVKFRSAVRPDDLIRAAIVLKPQGPGWQANFSLQRAGETVADGTIDLSSAHR